MHTEPFKIVAFYISAIKQFFIASTAIIQFFIPPSENIPITQRSDYLQNQNVVTLSSRFFKNPLPIIEGWCIS